MRGTGAEGRNLGRPEKARKPWVRGSDGMKKGYPADAGTLGVSRCGWDLRLVDGVHEVAGAGCAGSLASSTATLCAGTAGATLSAGTILWIEAALAFAACALAVAARSELGPLVRGEGGADAEEHFGVGFLEIGAGLGDLIDLGHGLRGVERIGAEHRLKQNLLLLYVGLEVDELEAALLEDAVHLFGLLGCEGEPLDDHGVLPPHAGGSHAEFAALAAAEVVAVTHHLRTAEALLHAWLHIALRHGGAHPLTHAGIRRRLALDGW